MVSIMVYSSFFHMLWTHFLIGIAFAVVVALLHNAYYKGQPRWLFAWGGDALSTGQQIMWLKWGGIVMLWEIVSSIFLMPANMRYYELSMSLFEGPAMLLGLFIIDRILEFWEVQPVRPIRFLRPVNTDKVTIHMIHPFDAIRARMEKMKDDKTTKQHNAEAVREAERQQGIDDLQNLTRGH